MAPSRGTLNSNLIRLTQQTENPPPSTLAAQIVNNLTKKAHSWQNRESFQQLLREILDAEDEKDGQSDSIETNVEVNHKIIYVVIRSGIEGLFRDDPFNKKAGLVEQGLRSVAVIGLTIKRSPEVLFFTPKIGEFEPKLNGPLFLWLIPILLSVLAYEGCGGIQTATLQLLQTILGTERRTHCPGIKPQSVLKYIQGCLKGKPSAYVLGLHTAKLGLHRSTLHWRIFVLNPSGNP